MRDDSLEIMPLSATWPELNGQPDAIEATLSSQASRIAALAEQLASREIDRIYLTGCGDSYYSPLRLKFAFEHLLGLSLETQCRQSLKNIEAILRAGGASLDDLVKVTVYLRDYDDFGPFNAAYEAIFGSNFPARTLITVAELPVVDGIQCRCIIEGIAYVGKEHISR